MRRRSVFNKEQDFMCILLEALKKQCIAYLDGQSVDGNLLGADLNCLLCYLDSYMNHWFSAKSQANLPGFCQETARKN
jgi:hypothetical protein